MLGWWWESVMCAYVCRQLIIIASRCHSCMHGIHGNSWSAYWKLENGMPNPIGPKAPSIPRPHRSPQGIRELSQRPQGMVESMDSIEFHGSHGFYGIHGIHGNHPWKPWKSWNLWNPWNPIDSIYGSHGNHSIHGMHGIHGVTNP